jgi:hypothetical protein
MLTVQKLLRGWQRWARIETRTVLSKEQRGYDGCGQREQVHFHFPFVHESGYDSKHGYWKEHEESYRSKVARVES